MRQQIEDNVEKCYCHLEDPMLSDSSLLFEDADKNVKPRCANEASYNKTASCFCHAGFKGDGHVCTGN